MHNHSEQHSRQQIANEHTQASPKPLGFDYSSDPSLDVNIAPVCFFQMFRYADRWDWMLLAAGLICAMANGVGIVFYANPYGDLTEAFAPGADPNIIVDKTREAVYGFLKNSVLVFLASWLMSAAWAISSERQAIRCRLEYLKAILRQEPAWHDRQKSAEIAEKMYSETAKLQTAIGTKLQSFLMSASLVVGGLVIALVRGWKMAIILMTIIPIMFVAGIISGIVNRRADAATDKIANRLAGNALEVLENIRTVKALGGEYYEASRFQKTLELFTSKMIKYSACTGALGSLYYFCIMMNYTMGFWLGALFVSRAIFNDNSHAIYSVADVIVIFFTIYISNLSLGQIPESLNAFQLGGRSAARVASVVDREPLIVSGSEPIPQINEISFSNVTFYYENPLFREFNLTIKKGRTAFVGESGSGKSTIVSMLMRFYDPLIGEVRINGQSLKNFNLIDLKESIGYVGQEPVLLGTTLREALVAENREDHEIIAALKAAQAWPFAKDIGLDSPYGQLSGGQKQRVAIARALIKAPQLLILDEATSALDRRNQKEIQNTIDHLEVPFVVMIAHKIETIAKADWIYVLDHGRVIQQGTYLDLMQQPSGRFFALAVAQRALPETIEAAQQPDPHQKQQKDSGESLIQRRRSQKKEEVAQEKKFKCSYLRSLFCFNPKYTSVFVVMFLTSIYTGCIFPLFSLYISRIIVLLTNIKYSPEDQRPQFIEQSMQLSLNLLIVSLVGFAAAYVRGFTMRVIENRISERLKNRLYLKLLKMSASFFDLNGSCSAMLSDCRKAADIACNISAGLVENITLLFLGLGIAFYYCWQITLASLALLPVLLIAGRIQMHFTNNYSTETDEANKRCHQQVVEALLNYKTVVSFNLQQKFINRYEDLLKEPLKIAVKRGNITGLGFGFAQAAISCIFALIFFLGALFIRNYHIGVLETYTAIYAVMFAAISAGGNLGFIGDMANAKVALLNVMHILEESEELAQVYDKGAVQEIEGRVEFRDVTFGYPLRKSNVLNKLSFTVEAGKKIALVGSSGCGKSTVISLLLRLYEPSSGCILIDGKPLREFDLINLRLSFGVVSQEPVLFNRTLYENIRYNQEASFEEIVQATIQANAYNFITEANFGVSELANEEEPEFDDQVGGAQMDCFLRKVGNKGSFLSGGQKQRVAIARALVRKPRIVLLDEATSALDSKNEQQIQATLDNITGQTQIIVAHRLSTIRNCDWILVFDKGEVVEAGTFQELLALRGDFYRLAMGQGDQK